MARSQQSFDKKEKEKKRLKKKQDKLQRKLENKEKPSQSSEEMIAYIDELGNIVDTPPEKTKKSEVDINDIQIATSKKEEESPFKTGRVDFFNEEKNFGFIIEKETKQKIFVHGSECESLLSEGNIVEFEIEKGPKGLVAVRVKKAK
jgi:cold shock CspA family protein